MKFSVSFKRWKEAQNHAIGEWVSYPDRVGMEFEEAKRKYQKTVGEVEERYNFQNDWRILDLGCGPTLVGRLFTKGVLVGLDPLVDDLGIRKLYPEVKIVAGRGEELPFADESFDVVFCRNVVDHSQSPQKVVSEAQRVLKKDGLFLLACYTYTPFVALLKILKEKLGIGKNIGHPFTFTPASLRSLVSGRFDIREEIVIHKGLHPNDYGKLEPMTHWSPAFDVVF